MSQIRPRQLFPLAALNFGTVTSDRVDCGSDVSLDDLPAGPCSMLVLAYPTTFTSGKALLSKAVSSTQGWQIRTSGTTGNVGIFVGHATTSLAYVTSDTPLKLSGWYWVAVTIDLSLGVGLRAKIYSGKLGGTLAVNALTLTEPVGARNSDAAGTLGIGNNTSINSSAFPGSIALAAVWNRGLTHKEFTSLTKGGGAGLRESNPVGLWRPGWQSNGGTVVHDESGNANHGTITGAVQSGVRVVL